MSTPPYTTAAGVQIGLLYQTTARPHHDADALRVQKAVTGRRDPIDADGIIIAMVTAVAVAGLLVAHWMGVLA